ncbi:MAG: tRNA (adenosine(37)-N6)-threonylcarbamoyltransferase complex ATPase subunit type 1 TsaE [Bacteroidetes bacterium]|nr:tRNA (adenosine(37)-N6)-threonylcarbamoyltransferase complex ATPase subunit type 1 TsaE [Bacteroidota bacterium]
MKHQIKINNTSELQSAAQEFLQICSGKKIFAFTGSMGAGKTTFIKAICETMGVLDTISSPTFSIVNEYRTPKGEKIFHFDFYRIKTESEAFDMGYEDYLYSNAYSFIEWPEKIESLIPAEAVKVNIQVDKETRIVSVEL